MLDDLITEPGARAQALARLEAQLTSLQKRQGQHSYTLAILFFLTAFGLPIVLYKLW
jgi:hypothetical protein